MNEYCPDSELSSAQTIYPTQADAIELITRSIDVVGAGAYPIVHNAPYSARIAEFSIQSGAGTGTCTLLIGGIAVTGLTNKSISQIETNYLPSDLNVFLVDQDITLQILSASSLTNVSVTLSIIRDAFLGGVTTTPDVIDDGTNPAFLEEVSLTIPAGQLLVDVPFGTIKLDSIGIPTTNYRINASPLENLTDAVVDRFFYTVVAKTPSKITLLLSGAPTTSQTVFRAVIATAQGATDILAAGGAGDGSTGTISTTSLVLKGDNAGNAVGIAPQTGDAAAGLLALNLFSSLPTYDALKLTGVINQAQLGTGGLGAGTKVLYDDHTFKTPTGGTGDVATDVIWDAKGDLAAATASDAAARFPVGPNNYVLMADSAQTVGLKYALLTDANVNAANKDGLAATASLRTLGTGAQQAVANDDSRLTGALQAANDLSDLTSAATARTNLGLGSIALQTAPSGTVASSDNTLTLTNKSMSGLNNTFSNIPLTALQDYATSTLSLTDPNGDRGLFWDDSAGTFSWFSAGLGLSISTTVLGTTIDMRQTPTTPAQITANQDNYNPGGNAYYQRWSTDASRNVTGLTLTTAQLVGQSHVIVNVGAQNIVLVNESASSTAGNRFHNTSGADITLAADQEANAWFDGLTARWRVSKRN